MTKETNILECVDIINSRVQPYKGKRPYLDTGGLIINTIKISSFITDDISKYLRIGISIVSVNCNVT